MRIQVVSDLHLEFGEDVVIPNQDADVLVLSGDICTANGAAEFEPFFDRVCEDFRDVVYVLGNHEHYGSYIEESKDRLQMTFSGTNLHILENGGVNISGVTFFGATLWTDCNEHDPETLWTVTRGMNDYRRIKTHGNRFTAVDTADMHKGSKDYLEGALSVVKSPVIICTHMAPSRRSLHPRYQDDHLLNGAYSSNLEDLITRNPQIRLWTHGHTHDSFDYTVGQTRVVCNPGGYPLGDGRRENGSFDINKVIEI